jgi:hypothetical protein
MEFDKQTRRGIASFYNDKIKFFKENHCLSTKSNYVNFLKEIEDKITEEEEYLLRLNLRIKFLKDEDEFDDIWSIKYTKAVLFELNKIKNELLYKSDFYIMQEINHYEKAIQKNKMQLKVINFLKTSNL